MYSVHMHTVCQLGVFVVTVCKQHVRALRDYDFFIYGLTISLKRVFKLHKKKADKCTATCESTCGSAVCVQMAGGLSLRMTTVF